MTTEPTAGQAKPDLLMVLLPLILRSVASGKPLDANDLLRALLQGALGVPALAAPDPQSQPTPAAPSVPQNPNDVMLELLLRALANKQQPAPADVAKVETPPAATAAKPSPLDTGASGLGFLGLILSALGQFTGVMPVAGEAATSVGPAVAGASVLSLIGGSLGAVSPTLGTLFNIGRGIFNAFRK